MKNLITNIIEDYKQSASYWNGSIFESVTHFSTDYKGKFGEELLYKFIKENTDIPVEWDADSNTANDDGVYDLFWYLHYGKKRRVEVKTSGRTVANGRPKGWQHENVYFADDSWDYLVFIDYDCDDIVVFTIMGYDEIVKDGELDLSPFGKKGHVRKYTGGKAKVDFSLRSHRLGIESGFSFRYQVGDDTDLLTLFFLNRLG
jgi:hypothetical protein